MSSYTVTVTIDPDMVRNLSRNGTQLCMARAAQDDSGRETFNVVAATQSLGHRVNFSWKDNYGIEASREEFRPGMQLRSSGLQEISLGDMYQSDSRGPGRAVADKNVPRDSIGFSSREPCSCVLYMNMGYGLAPFYISPNRMPPGQVYFKPVPKVMLWFQQGIQAGTMVSPEFMGQVFQVDIQPGNDNNVNFGPDGSWSR